MFYWYGFKNQPRSNMKAFNSMLFGIDSRSINNIIIPHNLHELVKRVNLYNGTFF